MPNLKYSLRERVYMYSTYIKNRKSCARTRRKFRTKFPNRPVPSACTVRRLAERFKQTGSINKPKPNVKRRVLTEEKLDEISERLEHTPVKSHGRLAQETGVSVSSARRATILLHLKPDKLKMVIAGKFVLQSKFDGEPRESDMRIVEEELPSLQKNDILCEAVYWSVDPYMRSFASSKTGSEMFGQQVAKIIESCHPAYPVGKYVVGYFGWRTHTVVDVTDPSLSGFFPFYIVPDIGDLPLSLALGVLGMPGNTAYFGLKEVCNPKPGEVVVVTGAAGAVGSHVGQIARILGCKAIGFAGTDEKVKWLTEELKFDKAYNYHTTNISEAIKEAAPVGVDIYFDNVGGTISDTIVDHMREHGRILISGSISTYNAKKGEKKRGTHVEDIAKSKHLRVENFAVIGWKDQWHEGIKQNVEWIKEGKLQWRETVTEGFENLPKAFIGMLRGENIGKAIVKA